MLLENFIITIANGAALFLKELIKYNNSLNSDLFENTAVKAFLSFVGVIGSIMYLFGLVFAIADWAITHQDNPSNRLVDTLKNVLIGFIALLSFSTIPVLLLEFTNNCCYELSNVFSANEGVLTNSIISGITGLISSFTFQTQGDYPSILAVIYVIILLVCFVRVFFGNIKRGGIMISLIFVGAIHLFSIPKGYLDAFWSWCRQVVGVCITAFLQNFLIVLGMVIMAYSNNSTGSLILSAGVCLASSEVPRILQQFGLDTSMKANVSQAIYGASGAISIIRAFV